MHKRTIVLRGFQICTFVFAKSTMHAYALIDDGLFVTNGSKHITHIKWFTCMSWHVYLKINSTSLIANNSNMTR